MSVTCLVRSRRRSDEYGVNNVVTIAVVMTVTISAARASLPELLNRVAEGEEVTITRHGRAIAVVVRPDTLRTRRAEPPIGEAENIRVLLVEVRRSPPPVEDILTAERAESLIRAIGAARDAR
jgi:prevent-host-death family protein